MLDLVFEEYTDLAADDEIHDMAKITLLPIVTVPEGGPGSSSTQVFGFATSSRYIKH